jgi:FkbM family methyltransferase
MKQNKWLDSPVNTYLSYFGRTDNPVIYEVGSRDGNDGIELANRISEGSILWENIVLFECNPPQQEVIRQSYPSATLITEAISNKKGTTSFLQIEGDANNRGSSSMDLSRVNYPWVQKTNTIEVPTRRLDDVIDQLGHKDIDIMKIDIEGYTYEALDGLGKYLNRVKVFHLESEIEGVAVNKTNLDIALFMQERGYLCTALEHEWGDRIQDQTWVRISKN